ncbi:hypothetical protein CASFOL_008908 [Castilleja foliolosa]|uniref:Peptidase A1 domain-containing protein n=1 Tax=Castilleja foliolosa TaxID=1961234 RepID=A0ABD3E0B2_9LAMI
MAFILKLIYSLLTFLIFIATKNCSALSIKLIHRHSVESPFCPGNITRTERINLLAQSSLRFSKQTKNTTSIRPRLDSEPQEQMYMIEVGIGTFTPPHPRNYNYFLHLDTGNDLTWTQCDECRKTGRHNCFKQKPPLFPSDSSTSYSPLPCNEHELCTPDECIGSKCSYDIDYSDGAKSFGYLARETFTFASSDGENKIEQVKDTVFGCGIRNKGFDESAKENLVAGNFGLGPGELSFLTQKMSLTRGRFSHCFLPWDAAHKSPFFLRFGSDIPERVGLKSTPLLEHTDFSFHFVNLGGISVGNTRLDIPQEMLAWSDRRDSGGCIVDSGHSVTTLPSAVFKKLRETLIKNHFSRYKSKMFTLFKLCYHFSSKNETIDDLPDITFHLQDSDLVFPPRLGFITDKCLGKRYFCLAMDSRDTEDMTIIGAFQQANMRFVFVTVKKKLYFGPEDCSRDA